MDFTKIDLSKKPDNDIKFTGVLFLDNSGYENEFISFAAQSSTRENVSRIVFCIDCKLSISSTAVIFPNTETVIIVSKSINSLFGIDEHKKIKNVIVDQEKKNSSFNYDALEGIELDFLSLTYLNDTRISVLELPKRVNHLALNKSNIDDLSIVNKLCLSSLKLTNHNSRSINGFELLSINDLYLQSCNSLVDFKPFGKLSKLYIECCSSINFSTIAKYISAREIFVSRCKQETPLNVFLSMKISERMEINNSRVIIEGNEKIPDDYIKELILFPIKSDLLKCLATNNPAKIVRR